MNEFQIVCNAGIIVFEKVLVFLNGLYVLLFKSGASLSVPDIVSGFIIVILLLASPFISANIAEKRNRSRALHFAGGLFIPYIYPGLIYFKLTKYEKPLLDEIIPEEEQRKMNIANIGKRFAEISAACQLDTGLLHRDAPAATGTDADIREDNKEVQQAESAEDMQSASQAASYYASIARDKNGKEQGPFMLEFKDGRVIEVSAIEETFPEHMELEMRADNGSAKHIRVPYQKIKNCVPKSQWI